MAVLILAAALPAFGTADAPSESVYSNVCFPVGEELLHKIYWGIIPVGRSMTTTEWIEEGGRKLIAIRLRTRTNALFDRIRPVNDVVESVVDPATMLPVRFHRRMIRRSMVCNETTTFDHHALKATWIADSPPRTNTFDIAADTRDVLSFMYYSRRAPFGESVTNDFRVMADEGIFDLRVVTEHHEDVNLPSYDKTRSLVFKPQFEFDGLLVERGHFELWVSDDTRRILTRAEIKNRFVNVNIVLQAVKGPGDDRWTSSESKEKEAQ